MWYCSIATTCISWQIMRYDMTKCELHVLKLIEVPRTHNDINMTKIAIFISFALSEKMYLVK